MYTSITASIQTKLSESFTEVLIGFCNSLMKDKTICSYHKYLSEYVGHKIDLHHMKKHGAYLDLINQKEKLMRLAHYRMYVAPCRGCNSCSSRKTDWPPHVQ